MERKTLSLHFTFSFCKSCAKLNGEFLVFRNALLSDLWFLRGNARDADHSPEVACSINFINMITVHGVLMVIGWAVFLQWGAFVARYMKFKSGLWFYVHVFFQVGVYNKLIMEVKSKYKLRTILLGIFVSLLLENKQSVLIYLRSAKFVLGTN